MASRFLHWNTAFWLCLGSSGVLCGIVVSAAEVDRGEPGEYSSLLQGGEFGTQYRAPDIVGITVVNHRNSPIGRVDLVLTGANGAIDEITIESPAAGTRVTLPFDWARLRRAATGAPRLVMEVSDAVFVNAPSIRLRAVGPAKNAHRSQGRETSLVANMF